ncbi:unnamed protein product, partial [Allacma fusca]
MSLGSNICDDVFKEKLGEGKSPDRSTGSNQPAMDSGEEQKSVPEKSVVNTGGRLEIIPGVFKTPGKPL